MFSLVWSQLDTAVKERASCLFGGSSSIDSSGCVAEGELVERWMGAGARAGA
jgi:hypothetical protein